MPPAVRWRTADIVVLLAGLVVAAAIRVALLPTEGFRGDLDQFVQWAHEIATRGLGHAYDGTNSFGPVMAYLWAAVAAIEPGLRTAADAADPAIRAAMKAPASLADLGLAVAVIWALRGRPRWAVAAGLLVALHPALIDDSAWWGQYESLYVLPAFLAFLLARSGHPVAAAVALAISLMVKPQALPFLVPFAAWALRALDRRSLALAIGALAATAAVLWLPFVPAGGPANYLRNLADFQNGAFAVLSLRAWNLWWLVQQALGGGFFVADGTPLAGPLTGRQLGLMLAAIGELVVFLAVWQVPSPRRLALGLAGAMLVSFCLLTTMHERYSFAALLFLVPLLPDRRVLAAWIALSVAITLNLLAAIPPTPSIGSALPIDGALGAVGSLVILVATGVCLWLLTHRDRSDAELAPA